MMLVGIVILVYAGKHDTNQRFHTIEHDLQVVQIRDKVAFPCTNGRDQKCSRFLNAIVRYSSYRQRKAIVSNGVATPQYLRKYIRHIMVRERNNRARLIARVKAKILKRRQAHAVHQAVIHRNPGNGNRQPGPFGGHGKK